MIGEGCSLTLRPAVGFRGLWPALLLIRTAVECGLGWPYRDSNQHPNEHPDQDARHDTAEGLLFARHHGQLDEPKCRHLHGLVLRPRRDRDLRLHAASGQHVPGRHDHRHL